jgi:type IV secretory pathway VirB10-like protein
MSGAGTLQPREAPSKCAIAGALRLRPDPPRVMHLSRKVMIGLGVVAGLGVGGAMILTLQGRSGRDAPSELYSTDRNPQADGLANLPRDYAGIPQLGPPLPGDLGRPILRAQERGQPVVPPAVATAPGPDPAEQRRQQEIEAARVARVIFETEGRNARQYPGRARHRAPFQPPRPDQRAGDRERLRQPHRTLYSDPAGRMSDRHLRQPRELWPKPGSAGWTRMILPNGRSIVLAHMPGADEQGFSGLQDGVDCHWGQLFLATGLSTLLGVGLKLGSSNESDIARTIRESRQDAVGRIGEEIVRRQLGVQPTLTVRPGFPVRVKD